jgi:large subunit ribosomal protein L15
MDITEITKKAGAKRRRRRVGRGRSSGHGKTCGRGHKGAGARTGATGRALAEGGMFPLFRRLPKFGFNNAQFRTEYQIVNVEDLEARFEDGSHVTAASLEEVGLIRDRGDLVKILGGGALRKKLVVEAHRFSGSATGKIEGSGGTAEWLGPKPKKKFVKRRKTAAEDGSKEKSKDGAKGGKKAASGTSRAKKK